MLRASAGCDRAFMHHRMRGLPSNCSSRLYAANCSQVLGNTSQPTCPCGRNGTATPFSSEPHSSFTLHSRAQTSTAPLLPFQVTINVVGSGLAAINKGQYIELDLYDVLLPSYADCLASYMNWRWNITTMDGQGRLLEFAFETNLPGEVCLPPKTFTMRTTPLLPDAPVGLQAGFHVRFTINVTEPARYMSMGLPLLDTRVGADQIKTVAAYKDGYPQYCSAHAEAEGGMCWRAGKWLR